MKQAATLRRPRHEWMDVLRGASILLVIFNHSILFASFEETGAPHVAVVINSILAPVRMPLMVFLSGLLLSRALEKPIREYVRGKAERVLYPFAVWTVIIIALESALEIHKGGGFPYHFLWETFYSPVAHLWFLYYLFIYYLVALATRKLPPLLVSAASLALCAVLPDDAHRFFLLLTFFMLGKWASQNAPVFEWLLASRLVLAAALIVSLVLVAIAVGGADVRYHAVSAPIVVAGITLLVHLSRRVQHARILAPLRSVGRDSIIYYLGHWYGARAGVVMALLAANGEPWAMVAFGTMGGLMTGIAFQFAYHHIPGASWLFVWPRRSSIPRAPVAQ